MTTKNRLSKRTKVLLLKIYYFQNQHTSYILFMLIGNKCHRNKINSEFPVEILNNSIPPAAQAKNLGVYIDSDLNFQHHIKNTVKMYNYFIRDIRRVRKPLLKRLHWLSIASRIDFKIATLTYKAVHLKQPASLAKHLQIKSMHLNTQNNDQLLLQHPPVGTNSYGRRAFSYTAPTVWNKVPDYIRSALSVMSFKKHLKTYYFGHLSRPPDGRVIVLSGSLIGFDTARYVDIDFD